MHVSGSSSWQKSFFSVYYLSFYSHLRSEYFYMLLVISQEIVNFFINVPVLQNTPNPNHTMLIGLSVLFRNQCDDSVMKDAPTQIPPPIHNLGNAISPRLFANA